MAFNKIGLENALASYGTVSLIDEVGGKLLIVIDDVNNAVASVSGVTNDLSTYASSYYPITEHFGLYGKRIKIELSNGIEENNGVSEEEISL